MLSQIPILLLKKDQEQEKELEEGRKEVEALIKKT